MTMTLKHIAVATDLTEHNQAALSAAQVGHGLHDLVAGLHDL